MSSLLDVQLVSKSYSGVQVLKDVCFSCQPGVVQGLVGENGAGKSTLIKIISGALAPESGNITFNGQSCEFLTPQDAISKGIRVVYQEFTLVPYLSIGENIALSSIPVRNGMIDKKKMNEDAATYLKKLDLDLDPRKLVKDLSVAEQQFVEIVKAISQKASILILDEPTAALNNYQVERLMSLIEEIRKTGVGVIFVSHRIPEVLQICDLITVMKDGEIVGTYPVNSLNQDKLVSLMVGRELRYTFPERKVVKSNSVLMEVNSLKSKYMRNPISIDLQEKEILGVYGLEGQGQREFLRTIAGLEFPTEGKIKVGTNTIVVKNPSTAVKSGIAYTPADRKGEGLAVGLSALTNMGIPYLVTQRKLTINIRKLVDLCQQQINNLRIKISSVQSTVTNLSGGNQQKIVIGKWISIHPKLLILDEPTRGIDVQSKMEIYSLLRSLSESGMGIIVLSSDLIELIGISDRMVIFFEGKISGIINSLDFSEEVVMAYATGTSLTGVQ